MKSRLLFVLALLSAIALPSFAGPAGPLQLIPQAATPRPFVTQAATASLLWDANLPADNVTSYKVYEKIGTVWTNIGTAPATAAPAFIVQNLTPGAHTYAVTALNALAESPRSNEVTTNIPNAPTNLRVTITLNLTTP